MNKEKQTKNMMEYQDTHTTARHVIPVIPMDPEIRECKFRG
jgi:hypothetical protein